MPDPAQISVIVAVAVLVTAVVFLVAAAVVIVRRSHGAPLSRRSSIGLAFLGALAFGTMALFMSSEILVVWPIPLFFLIATVRFWRQRRHVQAALVVVGFVLPWTTLWGVYVGYLVFGRAPFAPRETWLGFLGGLVPAALGLIVAARGDPAPPPPSSSAPAGTPGSRSFANIAVAILEPSSIGVTRINELAALIAYIATSAAVLIAATILDPASASSDEGRGAPNPASLVVAGVVASIVAAETWLRAMPARSRRAFEAFSWYGEYALAHARAVTGGRMPTTPAAAVRWLQDHPDRPDDAGVRAEILALAGRYDDARATAARIAAATPEEVANKAATSDLVDFAGGGAGDLDALRAAVEAIEPRDGDARLRAEVMLAAAITRRRMADGRATPGDAIEPFLAVRERLGHRADGQVGRALRRKLLGAFLVSSLVLGGAIEVIGGWLIPS